MKTFFDWLMFVIEEARRPRIEPGVLAGYEHASKDQRRKHIQRTPNPDLRTKLESMLDCPIRDGQGQCRSFTEYIVSAHLKNGVHERFDLEPALAYVVEKMLIDRTDAGERELPSLGASRTDPDQTPEFNPLRARFMKYLQFAVNNIRKSRIPRLANTGSWPPGTVSIGQGRSKKDEPTSGITPDEIKARSSQDADLGEKIEDIETLLQRKEGAYGFPLVDLFRTIMGA
jgi:hypothetical protein